MIKRRAIVFCGCLVTAACALSFLSAAEPEKDDFDEAETAPPVVKSPQTVAELDALIRKLDESGKGEVLNTETTGIGPMIRAMGAITDRNFIPALAKHLQESKSWEAKAGCVGALAHIETPESTKELKAFLESISSFANNDEARKKLGIRAQIDQWCFGVSATSAINALVKRGEFEAIKGTLLRFQEWDTLLAAGKPGLEAMLKFCKEAAEKGELLPAPGQITLKLARFHSPDCLELLRSATLDDKMPEYVRLGTITALAESGGAQEYDTVIKVAKTTYYPSLKRRAYELALKLKPEPTCDELLTLLGAPQPWLRGWAAYLLGTTGDTKFIPKLVALLDDQSDEARLLALEGLWLLDYNERHIKWKDPAGEKTYGEWIKQHPKPVPPAK